MKSLLVILINFFLVPTCCAQLVITPNFLDQPITYNPALLGLYHKESIQISLYSFTRDQLPSNFVNFSNRVNVNSFIRNESLASTAYQAKHIYYLSYHKTKISEFGHSITYGINAQLRRDHITKVNTPQTLGFLIQTHLPIENRKNKERKLSAGLSIDMIVSIPSKTNTSFLYSELLNRNTQSYKKFHSQFRTLGSSLSVNFNYLNKRNSKSLFTIGSSLYINYAKRLASIDSDASLRVLFFKDPLLGANISINKQRKFSRRLLLEYNLIVGSNAAISLGGSIKLKKNIFRIATSLTSDYENYVNIGVKVNFEAAKHNYSFFVGQNPAFSGSRIVQLGARYHLTGAGSPLLFRVN